LTLQDAAYLQASLQAYTRGGRRSGFMQNIAAQLSSEQIAALAHYYAGRPAQAAPAPAAAPAVVERGRTIATQGVWQLGLPACANCHDGDGSQITHAPHLAGQSETFLRHELTAMQHTGRGSTGWWNPMPFVAQTLSSADIAAVSAYYATLKPVRGPAGAPAPKAMQPPPDHAGDLANAKRIFDHDCEKCHAANGRGDREGEYPDLTLQTAPFVAQNLYAFRAGARPGVQMRQMTQGLSFDEMRSLAVYVNSLTPQPAVTKPDTAAAQRGAALATRGDPARGLPACLSCHGAAGVTALPLIPRLQGQNVFYLRKKLNEFAKPYDRNLSGLNPMPIIARQLSDEERVNVANYFAAAAPLSKPAAKP
ncbi:MAG: c-type cytochrome, partial [Caulobacteraceae bacterium]